VSFLLIDNRIGPDFDESIFKPHNEHNKHDRNGRKEIDERKG
jgi:hypothetical protein